MSNASALESALSALAVNPEHVALVELCRTLAVKCDDPDARADLLREYRMALVGLMEATAGGGDSFTVLLNELRAQVPNGADAGT